MGENDKITKVQTAFWLSREDKAAFEKAAERDGRTLTSWVARACHEKLRKLARERNGPMQNEMKKLDGGYRLVGDENRIKMQASGGADVWLVRAGQKSPWTVEGEIKLPHKNSFKNLRDARSYLRGLAKR